MPKLTDFDIKVLQEACRLGTLKVQIVGKVSGADKDREFERLKSATVLQHLGFLEPLADQDRYALWRPVNGCVEALRAVLTERRRRPS